MAKSTRSEAPSKAVIYIRQSPSPASRDEKKSALEQHRANRSVSLEAQLSAARALAQRKGYTVIAEHSDPALSGKDSIERRPGLQAVLQLASREPSIVVLVYSLSRLSRRQSLTWALLDDRGPYRLQVESCTEPFDTSTPMGKATIGMIAIFAQLEADLCSERTIAGLQTLRDRGMRLGAQPFAALRPDVVQQIQALYASGQYTTRSLAAYLNEHADQFPTKHGKRWHATQVRRTLAASIPQTLTSEHNPEHTA